MEPKNLGTKPRRIQRKEITVNVPFIKLPKSIQGFLDFIRGYGVVAIAIGLFLGADLKTIVDSITSNIINPILSLFTNNINFNNASACIKHVDSVCKVSIGYGAVINTIISFLIAAFVVYLIIRILRLDTFDKKKD